jgi:Raf kinase inhibitor-like YbhB/YbcL family protein
MIRSLSIAVFALLLVTLASCGAGNHRRSEANTGAIMDDAAPTKLLLTSDAFSDGGAIPPRFTCDGGGEIPLLKWSDPPTATKSFALVIDDPDAPGGTFRHWGVFDIRAAARFTGGEHSSGTEATNDFGNSGYGGPCPPEGNGPHHYHFKLFALDTEKLGLRAGAKIVDVENAARQHAIAKGELVGTYERR